MEEKKHIHFIGICGVAMSALALAFHKKGYTVTGSDKGFYPPVSTYLKDAGVAYYPGWHPEKMSKHGNPDFVIVGNVAGSKNPEWLYVQEQEIPYLSYPEALEKFFVKKHSIVCAGTYGKTTSSSLLTWIFLQHGYNPSYMFGGISRNNIPAAAMTDGEYSILEGDEYKSARWDNKAKFFHYAPTHLLLTSVVWDHADVYPTEASYDAAFHDLVAMLPDSGLAVVSEKVLEEKAAVLDSLKAPLIRYGKREENDYQYRNVVSATDGVRFEIIHKGQTYNVHTSELGDYMADNMTGCFALAHSLGIEPDNIISAMESFKSIKRRLEKRSEGSIHVFDDIAHSPKKAQAVLESLRNTFNGKIIAVFEPNTGNRQQEAVPGYDHRFTQADTVIIPRLSAIKHDSNKPEALDGQALKTVIEKTHSQVEYIDSDETLVRHIIEHSQPGDVIVFLGSHGFRGMIEQVTKQLR